MPIKTKAEKAAYIKAQKEAQKKIYCLKAIAPLIDSDIITMDKLAICILRSDLEALEQHQRDSITWLTQHFGYYIQYKFFKL